MSVVALDFVNVLCTCFQAVAVTPTPGTSGEADPVTERKYRENFHAAVSTTYHFLSTIIQL